MSLLKLLQEQTAENRDKTSIREVDESASLRPQRRHLRNLLPPPHENRLYFYNPDVDQPWLKTTATGA